MYRIFREKHRWWSLCLPLSRAGTVHVLSVVVRPLTVNLRSPYWHPAWTHRYGSNSEPEQTNKNNISTCHMPGNMPTHQNLFNHNALGCWVLVLHNSRTNFPGKSTRYPIQPGLVIILRRLMRTQSSLSLSAHFSPLALV